MPRRGGTQVVGAPLEGQHEAVVVDAEGRRPLQVQHLGVAGQLGDGGVHPRRGGRAVEGVRAAEQRAAGLGLLVDEGDPRAGAGGGERRDQPGGAGADDQHVDVPVHRVVAGGVGDVGQPALPGDATGGEAVVQLDGGGQQHRLGERLLDLHQAAGVLRPGRGDAAGPAELGAGGHRVPAGGQQRRGERVAGVPAVALPVEGELQLGGAVDPPARGGAERLAGRAGHRGPPCVPAGRSPRRLPGAYVPSKR
jgi:hypothetical protein